VLGDRADPKDRAVADAIRDHYKPQGADDDVPTAPVSVAVALADKIDTLTAFWAIGKKPTGSSDPFALRRAALGIIAILLQPAHPGESRDPWDGRVWIPAFAGMSGGNLRVHLMKLVSRHTSLETDFSFSGHGMRTLVEAGAGFQGSGFGDPDAVKEAARQLASEIVAFFHDRLKVYLKDKGHRYDAIDAVLTKADGTLEDDLVLIVMKLEALEAFLRTDDGANLAAGYRRAANILKAEEKKGALPDASAVDGSLLQQAEEKALFAALALAEEKAARAVAAEKFADAMSALASLRAPIDAFFDKVTVNAEDAKLRANRLALLQRFIAATATVADLGKLEG
jgi:glycyl-tRNA synthetase beta chain